MDIQFGGYLMKRRERRLAGPNGPIELSARSFDILETLLASPNQVIGKSALFDAVWLHGEAANRHGERGLTAETLIDAL